MAHAHPQVRVSPIFAVTDLPRALEHYSALGCVVSTYSDTYGFAVRGGVELHLVVPDAGERPWRRPVLPRTCPRGPREARHVDPDGNLVRFGSRLPSPG